ncbi:hypothetical protein ACTWPT_50690 [Nonomuraea sp. 3N208]|uniref:hypothetical protein n=1 Tax=Nonomuraea sp. 3N208 TaxID=3457421 RepID=UPI003FD27E00
MVYGDGDALPRIGAHSGYWHDEAMWDSLDPDPPGPLIPRSWPAWALARLGVTLRKRTLVGRAGAGPAFRPPLARCSARVGGTSGRRLLGGGGAG